jgi:hypothetical protein
MKSRAAALAGWLLVYSLTRYGPPVEEPFPTEDQCIEAGFKWLEGADRWKHRSGVTTRGPFWYCAESSPKEST